MYIKSYKELIVWQKSIDLVIEVYILTSKMPKEETYSLVIQERRAAISIPSNIAEGQRRKDLPEFLQFLRIADASSAELETQIIISKRLYPNLDYSKVDVLLEEVQKMLNAMIRNLEDKLKAKSSKLKANAGQSLVEIIIAIAVGAILIGAGTVVIVPILRSNLETRNVQITTSLAQEYLDNLQNLTESSWFNIYNPPGSKGPSSQFYLRATSTTYELISGTTSTVIEGKTFTRYFSIENVNRELCGAGNITTGTTTVCTSGPGSSGVADDPSTQKITATVTWPEGRSISRSQYLTRSRNKVFVQTDWSAGFGQEGPITSENNKFASSTGIDYATSTGSIIISGLGGGGISATGTIDSTYKYAWQENVGWINFGTSQGNVVVSNTELTGYAWAENIGWISLNCSNTSSCGTVSYKVSNDTSGNLSGYAWAENVGWINFGTFTNSAKISVSTGEFSGYAWGENIGWISFNCSNTSSCGTVDYKVKTNWGQ